MLMNIPTGEYGNSNVAYGNFSNNIANGGYGGGIHGAYGSYSSPTPLYKDLAPLDAFVGKKAVSERGIIATIALCTTALLAAAFCRGKGWRVLLPKQAVKKVVKQVANQAQTQPVQTTPTQVTANIRRVKVHKRQVATQQPATNLPAVQTPTPKGVRVLDNAIRNAQKNPQISSAQNPIVTQYTANLPAVQSPTPKGVRVLDNAVRNAQKNPQISSAQNPIVTQ